MKVQVNWHPTEKVYIVEVILLVHFSSVFERLRFPSADLPPSTCVSLQ